MDKPRAFPYTPMQKLTEVLALLALLLPAAYLVYIWNTLPERIPTHFTFAGEADGWGGKGSLWIFPVIGGLLYLTFAGVGLIPPRLWNVPVTLTAENASAVISATRWLLLRLKLELLLAFALATYFMARGQAPSLAFWPLIILLPILEVIMYFVAIHRAR